MGFTFLKELRISESSQGYRLAISAKCFGVFSQALGDTIYRINTCPSMRAFEPFLGVQRFAADSHGLIRCQINKNWYNSIRSRQR